MGIRKQAAVTEQAAVATIRFTNTSSALLLIADVRRPDQFGCLGFRRHDRRLDYKKVPIHPLVGGRT